MDRKVPRTVSEEVELYERTIYSLLRSTTDVQLRTLEEVHASTNSSLHPKARSIEIDTSALVYTWLRLPPCMVDVERVVMGQNEDTFTKSGYADVARWESVRASARRRRYSYDPKGRTLAAFIASRSDIDDLVPSLVAFQIEWNKIHNQLNKLPETQQQALLKFDDPLNPDALFVLKQNLAAALEMSMIEVNRLYAVWGNRFVEILKKIASRRLNLRVQLLNGSLTQYWRATHVWWNNIEEHSPDIRRQPVYFISSNTHVFLNLVSGYALSKQQPLIQYLRDHQLNDLVAEWKVIENDLANNSIENFLYYILKKVQQSPQGEAYVHEQNDLLASLGVKQIPSTHSFDVEAQVFPLSSLDPDRLDPRAKDGDLSFLKHSNALLLNIDYPLGIAAYNILRVIAENTEELLGIYIMGKAATLNAVRGDVMIPNVVQDEHSLNTYLFNNAFEASDLSSYLKFGTVLDNQKAVSVLGTFMQNSRIMDVVYREGYTDIEMEAGPYLSAVCEMIRPNRHPYNEIVNLYPAAFDIGILHYASDTPLSKGQNLGAGTLSYAGMDATYGAGVAILRRIFEVERQRLNQKSK